MKKVNHWILKVVFQNYCHPTYTQTSKQFIKNLSIIDLLFNHGSKSKDILMKNNISEV